MHTHGGLNQLVRQNSHVDFYVGLATSLIRSGPYYSTNVKSSERDIETLQSRCSAEGLAFLTKCLPKLGKALDQGMLNTQLSVPREFKRSSKNRGIPAFLQAYFKRVFNATGTLRDDADIVAVKFLRQVCFFLYKLELPYTREQETSVVEAFVRTEGELELELGGTVGDMVAAASYITRDVFAGFDPKDIVPRHGPGAVATGEHLDEKWDFSRLYNEIHQVYPYYEYFIVGGARELIDRLEWYKSLERRETGVAKVVLVPKDSRGPRLISCEPLEYQWIQQGLGRKIMCHLESFWMTKGHVNFTNQEVNRSIALESSKTLKYATLDLKEASDRVSLDLVRAVFKHCPELLRALEATRSSATTLPSGRVLPLKKFAPMGSALCFPVEAFCFWAIIVASLARRDRVSPSKSAESVFVYGDDIIVATEDADFCMQALESVGLLVNKSKSCIHGPFRESCGMDAFRGVQVTPIRCKAPWTGKSSDATAFASYVALRNNLASEGYTGAVLEYLEKHITRTYGKLPYGTKLAAYPCIHLLDAIEAEARNIASGFKHRVKQSLQRVEFLLSTFKSGKVVTRLDSWNRLLRDVVMGGGDTPSETVVPRSVKIKRRWTAVY